MNTVSETLAKLRRPRLLVSAARAGIAHWHRERDLERLVGSVRESAIAPLLIEREDRLEAARKSGSETYEVRRHVDVLTALVALAAEEQARANMPALKAA